MFDDFFNASQNRKAVISSDLAQLIIDNLWSREKVDNTFYLLMRDVVEQSVQKHIKRENSVVLLRLQICSLIAVVGCLSSVKIL